MMRITMVVMPIVVGDRRAMHGMVVRGLNMSYVLGRRLGPFSVRGNTFHRDSRERLNRKAQHQQYDDEEFAPVRHRSGV
ncbi:hypothetical protein [Trinickia symbiotica]|uniref:hypothetical protein n=1 Tax=Trinickia symbiotica TaxID=863227 RepID=UPI0015E6B9E1|nr:hypothetical protein [Trinickia symbiotica]